MKSEMMKKVAAWMSIIIFASTFGVNTALAAPGDDYRVNVHGYADTIIPNTYVVDFQVQTLNDAGIATWQSTSFAYDTSIFKLVKWATGADLDYEIMPYLPTNSAISITGMEASNTISGWNEYLCAGRNEESSMVYLLVQPSRDPVFGMNHKFPELSKLQSVRLAFQNGKSFADVTENSIRLLTATELNRIKQNEQIKLNDGLVADGYSYGKQINGIFTPADDALTLVDINFEMPRSDTDITFNSLTANGAANSVTTTELTLTFSQAIPGLTVDDITLIGGASKGTFSGSGPIYTLSVTDITTDGADVTVEVKPPAGYTITPLSLSTKVYKASIYGISLSETGVYTFPAAASGYPAQMSRNVVITNTGNQPTGDLTVALSGANANNFTLSATNVASIVVEGNNSFTVVPNAGLEVGTYNATVTVSGGNDISAIFSVSFTVNEAPKPSGSIVKTVDKLLVHRGEDYSYTIILANAPDATDAWKDVVVTDVLPYSLDYVWYRVVTGGGVTSISEGGGIIKLGCGDIPIGGIVLFEIGVRVTTSAAIGTIIENTAIAESLNDTPKQDTCISPAIVEEASYGISLSATGTYIFPSANYGYPAQTASIIVVTNNGNQPTGALSIALSGANANAFTLSKINVVSIAVDGTDSFTVAPILGLAAGTYNATITVSGNNGISASFDVIFKVSETPKPGGVITKTANKDLVYRGETYTYTITLANTTDGADIWEKVVATDVLPYSLEYIGNRVVAGNNISISISGGIVTVECGDIATGSAVIVEIDVRVTTSAAIGTVIENTAIAASDNNTSKQDTDNTPTIVEEPTYGISLSETGTYIFTSAEENYTAQTPRNVVITNTGNQPTSVLAIALSGANANAFTLSATNAASIAVGGNSSFTIAPNTGLPVGVYTATVTVSSGGDISASFNVSFTVTQKLTYSISLSEIGTYIFPTAEENYAAQTARNIVITNTGNQPTGVLTIALSGANANAFTLSATNVASIGVGGNSNFTVVPNTGLAVGVYTATVTVSGGNDVSASFNVSFTITQKATYGISLSETGTYTFPSAEENYTAQTARNVVITNTGNQPTGALTISLRGTNANAFTLSATNVASIDINGNSNFTIVPNTGLTAGVYTTTVTVSGGNDISASFNVSFTVTQKLTYSISLNETGTYIFPAAEENYAAQTAKNIVIINTGNQPTGALTIALSGTNANAFVLSATNVASIAVNGNNNFTVAPNTGLSAGVYTATVTVSGDNDISASLNVRFTVNPTGGITYIDFKYDGETATGVIPGKKLSVEAVFADPVDTPQTLIAALFKKNGVLITLVTSDGVIENEILNFSVDLDIPKETEKGAYVKVFVWNSQTFVPMYEATSFIDNEDSL